MVVSRVGAPPLWPPAMRSPIETRCALMRPASGARDAGEFQVELRLSGPPRWACSRAACGGALLLHALVEQLAGGEVAAVQLGRAGDLAIGEVEPGRRRQQLGLGLLQRDLVRARVDDEEQVALVDDLAVGEMDLGQIAADLGAELDRIDRRELAGELRPGREAALQRWAHRHRRGRGRELRAGGRGAVQPGGPVPRAGGGEHQDGENARHPAVPWPCGPAAASLRASSSGGR